MTKRGITFILAVMMLVTILVPFPAFAGEDGGLEQAIKVVREKFDIPSKLTEFDYNISTEGDKKVWYLNWNSKDGIEGNLHVRIDGKGTILGYNYYKPYDHTKKKLPRVGKQEARENAEAFIQKVNPQILPQIRLNESNTNFFYGEMHYFNFVRMVNGIPFYNNSISVEVNKETGDVQSYNLMWSDEVTFPAADKAISVEQAQKAFKEKLGVKLAYNSTYNEQVKIFPAYTLKYPYNLYIDALTGEKVQLEPVYFYGARGDAMYDKQLEAAQSIPAKKTEITLTPEEQKAIEKVSKLLGRDAVEKIAREVKVLELSSDYKVVYANLNRDWQFKDDFIWNLSFQKDPSGDTKDYSHISVSINAVTGEVKNFYIGRPYEPDGKAKYDEAASRKAVEAFLKEFKQGKFAQTEYDDSVNNHYYRIMGKEAPTQYNFNYVRKVNGIPFPGNSLQVNFDAVSGKIVNFHMNWFDMEFPAVDQAMNIESMYDKLFKETGFELQYKIQYNREAYGKILPEGGNIKPEVRLVYDVKRTKPLIFDAFTGVVLNYNGEPYKEVKPVEYSDIEGHYAQKQILALAEYGISLEGSQFRPDEGIVQKDFLRMLSKIMSNYYGPVMMATDKELEQMYAMLIREGVVRESEKAPDAPVTREEGVKFLIRALKYDKVAGIKGIFKSVFKDEDQINPDLIGYVTIAQGLKLINGHDGYFNPKGQLTRAQAAIIIYNYLQN